MNRLTFGHKIIIRCGSYIILYWIYYLFMSPVFVCTGDMLLFHRPYIPPPVFIIMIMCHAYESTSVKCTEREMCCSSVSQPKVPLLTDMQGLSGRKTLVITAPRFLPENAFLAVRNITVSKHAMLVKNIYSYITTTYTTMRQMMLFLPRHTLHVCRKHIAILACSWNPFYFHYEHGY